MKMDLARILISGGLIFALIACGNQSQAVTGTVSLPSGSSLPEGSVTKIQIRDLTQGEVPERIVDETKIPATENANSIAFNISYDPNKIDSEHPYGLFVQVEDVQGKILYENPRVIPVITQGASTNGIDISLSVPVDNTTGELQLTSRPWSLVKLNGNPLLSGTEITAIFGGDGKLTGSSGCNTYNAPYQVYDSQLFIGQIVTTLNACGAAIMQQESGFFQALSGTANFKIDQENLSFFDASGDELVAFVPQKIELAGSSWVVTSYNDGTGRLVPVLPDTQLNTTFGVDGNIGGTAGCNDYFAAYSVNADVLEIGQVVSTKATCSKPQGIMEQETAFLSALQDVSAYQLVGTELKLIDKKGTSEILLNAML